jgi:hypothetical protein
LLRPTEDLEVNGDEVLIVEYSARDDFGIGEVNLVARVGEREEKIRLLRDEAKRLILRDQFKWDLGKLALREGDEAVFSLQVLDNDTISGPKLGTSRSVRLRLKNLRSEHQQVADMIRDLNARMVDLLGDHLEPPLPGTRTPRAKKKPTASSIRISPTLEAHREIMQRAEKTACPIATWSDLEALKRNLDLPKTICSNGRSKPRPTTKAQSPRRDFLELERMSML